MTHVESAYPSVGRESEAYLSELALVSAAAPADDDLHIFMQGGRDEVAMAERKHRMGSIAQRVAKLAARRDIGFVSITGKVRRPRDLCELPEIRDGLEMRAVGLKCDEQYVSPVRAPAPARGRPRERCVTRASAHPDRRARTSPSRADGSARWEPPCGASITASCSAGCLAGT